MRHICRIAGRVLLPTVLFLVLSHCSKSTNSVDEGETDRTAPEVISDLTVVRTTSHSVTLQWTAPHDYTDSHDAGFVDDYDLRISYASINANNFADAYPYDSVPMPAPAGLIQEVEIDQLDPDSGYYFAVKACDNKGNWSGVSNCCYAHCPPILVVMFPDTALDRVIRNRIQKPTGDLLTSDLDTISQLIAPNENIRNLSGLECCVSLHVADLSGNHITDITPLAGCTWLWGLSLASNDIVDISPLAALVGITQLSIGNNPITDIGPLASLSGLHQLFMYATQVADYSPLYGLAQLDDVHFALNNLTDISFMSHLKHVRICNLNNNEITSIAPLAADSTLEHLGLGYNQISDLSPLEHLPNLTSLSLPFNAITDIMPLVNNPAIDSGDVVDLQINPLAELTIGTQIPNLLARHVTVYW